ncbi:nucleotidyltransferase family protein [Virgibacillus ndiopensis]|uniref:nucleotidyltransferase family protein n=1 Tax=Virgibacillus ndiopensis TaxID=2004408 RepID=UPI000C08B8A7|nr:nucleotidyltransferase family protein [Virgibacillus ndiopensis]
MIKTEQDIIRVIEEDIWMMEVLHTAKSLDLPDWWVCAGFVRSKIWDILHGYKKRTKTQDVDVVYFDQSNLDETEEKRLEKILTTMNPAIPWSVKNEARMHLINDLPPYQSSEDAIAKFPETPTALGVKLDVNDRVMLTAPHGIKDVVQLNVKPTPLFRDSKLYPIYKRRIKNKEWKTTWPNIKLYEEHY